MGEPADTQDSLKLSDAYNDQEVHLRAPKKMRRHRIKYSEKQTLELQTYFNNRMYPSKEQCLKLAQNLGVTEYQIRIWFKNNRAEYKRKNLQNTSEPPEKMGNSKDIGGSTSSQGCSSLTDSATGESMSSDTSSVGSISQIYASLEEILHIEQGLEGARCGLQEGHCDGQAPAAAAGPGHF